MIPVHIISYNLLAPLQRLVADVARLDGVGEITIHDHASTYGPLLDYYCGCGVKVVRHPVNRGPTTLWEQGTLSDRWPHVVTDSDLDISQVPRNVLEVLESGLDEFPDVIKCGLSLEIEDLPDTPSVEVVRRHEGEFWKVRRGQFWAAPIDTTFALYRPERTWGGYKPAPRTDRPYVARHTPWYWQLENLTDEQRYYLSQQSIGTWWTSKLQREQREASQWNHA